jgi:Lactate racemase N-terminal domain
MVIYPYQDRDDLLSSVPFPELVMLRQRFTRPQVLDVAVEVAARLESGGVAAQITPGARIAVAVGSRGIANIALIVRTLVTKLRGYGAEPFIVPAMGSHGGATAEGQVEVLTSLGVTPEYIGAPIISSFEVDQLGVLSNGLPVYIDRAANQADGIIVVNRIKPHTDFDAPIESGLAKMVAIGLGKHQGALTLHSWGLNGLTVQLPNVAQFAVQHAAILFGLAIIENAYDEVAEIVLLPAHEIGTASEQELTERAKALMPRLPWDTLDVLVIDEMGKDISGAGMDPNIIGRIRWGKQKATATEITSLVILDLSEASHGNAIGMGMADFTTRKFLEKVDMQASYVNSLTAGVIALNSTKIPMVLEHERAAVAAAIRSSGQPDLAQLRLARIQNTLKLEYILASKAAAECVRADSNIEIIRNVEAFAVENDYTFPPFLSEH